MRGVGYKMNKILLCLIILILSLNIVLAADMLEISEVTLTYDSDSQNFIGNNQTYGTIIQPGDSFKLDVEISNNFKTSTDMNDINITATIYNITDGVDLIENADAFDLNSNDGKSKRLTFDLPLNSEELTKILKIYAIGKGDDGNYYSDSKIIYLNIEDDDHNIYIYNSVFSPSTITCNQTTNLYVWLYNDGKYDEGDVVLKAYNKELDIDKLYSGITIKEGVKYGKTIGLGPYIVNKLTIYPIEIRSYYKTAKLDDVKIVNLFVNPCPANIVKNITSSTNETEQTPDVVVTDSTENIAIKGYTTTSTNLNDSSGNSILVFFVILIGLVIIGFMIKKLLEKDHKIEIY